MFNSLARFTKDAVDLTTHKIHFYKAHWKGAIVLNVALVGAMVAAYEIEDANHKKCKRKQQDQLKVDYEVKTE